MPASDISTYLSTYLPIYVSIHLFIHLPTYLHVSIAEKLLSANFSFSRRCASCGRRLPSGRRRTITSASSRAQSRRSRATSRPTPPRRRGQASSRSSRSAGARRRLPHSASPYHHGDERRLGPGRRQGDWTGSLQALPWRLGALAPALATLNIYAG